MKLTALMSVRAWLRLNWVWVLALVPILILLTLAGISVLAQSSANTSTELTASSPIVIGDTIVFGYRGETKTVNSGKVTEVTVAGSIVLVKYCGPGFGCQLVPFETIRRMSDGRDPNVLACVIRGKNEKKCVDISPGKISTETPKSRLDGS